MRIIRQPAARKEKIKFNTASDREYRARISMTPREILLHGKNLLRKIFTSERDL